MSRLRILIPALVCVGIVLALGAWYWQPGQQLAVSHDPVPQRIETRRLEVGLDAQRQQVDTLTTRLDASLKNLEALEQRVSVLDERYRQRASGVEAADHLPGTLEEIVAHRTAYLRSRDGTREGDDASRVSALSSDTGIPQDKIREALGR